VLAAPLALVLGERACATTRRRRATAHGDDVGGDALAQLGVPPALAADGELAVLFEVSGR
jgi:hypothetical protein